MKFSDKRWRSVVLVFFIPFFLGKRKSWPKKKFANFMLIKMYFEIFLVYKPLKSGNHLEKEPSA